MTTLLAPVGSASVERARRRFVFESENPFSLDFNWPEENAFGEMRGLGACRIEGARPARIHWTVEADTVTTVRAAGDSSAKVSVFADAGAPPRIAVQALVCPPDDDDPLLRAMLGEHALQWMHSLIHAVGLPAWAVFAREAGVWSSQLDMILSQWRELNGGAERALWRCAGDQRSWNDLQDWMLRLEEGMTGSDIDAAVRVCLAANAEWASSPQAEWLEACSGFPLAMLSVPVAVDGLKTASITLHQLIKSGLTPPSLSALREMAEASLGKERLSPASVRTLRQKKLRRQALMGVCRDIYSELQSCVETATAESLGLMISGACDSWPLTEATFDFSHPSGMEEFQAALAGDTAALHVLCRSGRAEPSLLSLSASRPICLRLSMPPLPFRRAHHVLKALSKSEVQSIPGHRIEVRPSVGRTARLQVEEESLVRRLASAPMRAASREPWDPGAEFACEDSFLLSGDIPAALSRRLLQHYRLPSSPGSGRARLRIFVPEAWTEVWQALPHSRDETFARVFSSICETLQASVRRWLPHLALKDARQYCEPLSAMPLLVHAASKPFTGVGKRKFTYERHTASGFQKAFDSADGEFQQILREVHRDLRASGHRSTRTYDPNSAQTILGTVFRQRQHFSSLLAIDALLMEEVFHLADSAAELHSLTGVPKFSTKLMLRWTESSQSGLRRRFRGVFDGRSFDLLLSIAWIEATAAACRAMGAQAEVAAVLKLEYPDGCEHFYNAAASGYC